MFFSLCFSPNDAQHVCKMFYSLMQTETSINHMIKLHTSHLCPNSEVKWTACHKPKITVKITSQRNRRSFTHWCLCPWFLSWGFRDPRSVCDMKHGPQTSTVSTDLKHFTAVHSENTSSVKPFGLCSRFKVSVERTETLCVCVCVCV